MYCVCLEFESTYYSIYHFLALIPVFKFLSLTKTIWWGILLALFLFLSLIDDV